MMNISFEVLIFRIQNAIDHKGLDWKEAIEIEIKRATLKNKCK